MSAVVGQLQRRIRELEALNKSALENVAELQEMYRKATEANCELEAERDAAIREVGAIGRKLGYTEARAEKAEAAIEHALNEHQSCRVLTRRIGELKAELASARDEYRYVAKKLIEHQAELARVRGLLKKAMTYWSHHGAPSGVEITHGIHRTPGAQERRDWVDCEAALEEKP